MSAIFHCPECGRKSRNWDSICGCSDYIRTLDYSKATRAMEVMRKDVPPLTVAQAKLQDELIRQTNECNRLRTKNAELREALSELYAQVNGECPSLLREDSGGDAKLDWMIREALKEDRA